MRIPLYRTTVYLTFIMLCVAAAATPFEIQVFDGDAKVPPSMLISGKRYRLQAISPNKKTLSAQWFIAGNLGRITTGETPTLTAVFVGTGDLICRVNGIEQRVQLRVIPATKTMGSNGGKLQSPAGVAITLPEGALATDKQIGIDIVSSPGLPPTTQRFVRVVRISPEQLVLKRSAQITFFVGAVKDPQLYFWEVFGKKWVQVQSKVDATQGSVTAFINHFGIYTLMASTPTRLAQTDRLKIDNIKLSPRVFFSPETQRLTITYQLNAPEAAQAFVTMDIFDLRGRRVRRLFEDSSRSIGANAAQWDGLTDDGSLVRNGRYLLIIRAKTGSQHAAERKLIVVFK